VRVLATDRSGATAALYFEMLSLVDMMSDNAQHDMTQRLFAQNRSEVGFRSGRWEQAILHNDRVCGGRSLSMQSPGTVRSTV